MDISKKLQIFVIASLSLGTAYSQTVVIDGSHIRVDASPGAATSNTHKRAAVKKSSAKVSEVGKTTATAGGENARVSKAVKNGKVFVNADFSGQDLSHANYAGASFTNIEAVGTNFRGVDLSRSIMTNVDLSQADFRGANLSGAQMTNVDWDGALLDGAIWVDGRRCGSASVGGCR